MRLDINLASQPYEDARQFWARWGAGVGAVAVLTLILLTLTITGWFNARRDHAAISQTKALIAERDERRAEAETFLNQPQNRSTRDESQFLNEMIERKSFSWTRVLESLEKVMPPRVHLVNISPGLDEDNQLSLKMSVAGESRDRALELMRRMEESKRFTQTVFLSETYGQSATGDNERVDFTALYVPEPPIQQETKSATDAKNASGKTSSKSKTDTAKPSAKPANPMTGVSRPPAPAKGGQR